MNKEQGISSQEAFELLNKYKRMWENLKADIYNLIDPYDEQAISVTASFVYKGMIASEKSEGIEI